MTERLHFSLSCIGEGTGNPFQCSCLENPRDGGAWWATIYGVAQRRQPIRLPCPWDSPGKNTIVGCHFLLQCMKVKSEVAQSCPTLSDPTDGSPPGSSVHEIFQARVLEWGAIAFSVKLFITPLIFIFITSDQISRSVVSDSLRPHESQHARPPCPSPTPGVHSDSRPSSQ